MTAPRTINAIAPWFGANRERAELVGKLLGKLAWCGVPFMGGGAELPWIDTSEGVAGDLHRHVINLARVIREPDLRAELAARLDKTLFHEEEFRDAQRRCADRDGDGVIGGLFVATRETGKTVADDRPSVDWAFDYFVCCWMGPGAKAGKPHHFTSYFPVRMSASGGSSAKRFRSAVESLDGWCEALRPWSFVCRDAGDLLDRVAGWETKRCKAADAGERLEPYGIYCDPPWPEAGRKYEHKVDDGVFHRRLEERLRSLTTYRVVVRYGDHPIIRGLYGRPEWEFVELKTRSQANTAVAELLIVRRPQ